MAPYDRPTELDDCSPRISQCRGTVKRRRYLPSGSSRSVTATANSGYTFATRTENRERHCGQLIGYTLTLTGQWKCPEFFALLIWAERRLALAQAVMTPLIC
jgi:hypothetical protein